MNKCKFLIGVLMVVLLSSCVSLPVEEDVLTPQEHLPEPERVGIYHKVQKSETLWRIAKTYDVSLEDIIRSNNIPNVAQIEKGQLIFIPGAYNVRQVNAATQEERENDFSWPVKGDVINYFHQQHNGILNKGIDIKVAQGTTVQAARSGDVVFADELTGYGKTIVLAHSGGFHTLYCHNNELLVKMGERVNKNSPLAKVGRNKSGSFLHFEIRKETIENNPLHYLP